MENESVKSGIDLYQVLVGLIPVIVGGFLAVIGTFSGSVLTYYLNRKEKRGELKREKLEQLMIASNRTAQWLDDYKSSKFLMEKKDLGINPIEEVKYLSALYFRELHDEVLSLTAASATYFSLITKCHVEQLKTGNIPSLFLENLPAIYAQLIEANSNLLKKASTLAEHL